MMESKQTTLGVALGLMMLLLTGLTAGRAAADSPSPRTLIEGLDHPSSLAFLPDGRMLISERSGQLRVVDRSGEAWILHPDPIAGAPPVHYAGQGGLLEVLPAPEFSSSGWLYLSYAHGDGRASSTRLARARLVGHALVDLQVLFTAAPLRATSAHYGGRMAWMADGTLLLTLGDGFDYRERAQSLDDHLGSIVRLNADGSPPPNNPFVGAANARAEIYSYGHRNVQGIVVVRSADGSDQVLAHEHGPRGGDELNRILPGRNYGWPLTSFGVDYSGAQITPFTDFPDVQPPLLHWTPSIAPAGLAWYDDTRHPGWQGSLFVTALAERSLRRVRLHDDGRIEQEILLADLGERLRDVRVGSDGALYVLTDGADARLLRLAPPSSASQSSR